MRAWRLLKLGVSLAEQGRLIDGEAPADLLDWLIAIDNKAKQVERDHAEAAQS